MFFSARFILVCEQTLPPFEIKVVKGEWGGVLSYFFQFFATSSTKEPVHRLYL